MTTKGRAMGMWQKLSCISVAVASVTFADPTAAAPALRHQIDIEGDFALIGNTIGQDCANGTPAPIVGTVGNCGTSVSDTSPDVFWRADAPADGAATADMAIASVDARSTAVLVLPAGAEVTFARVYWAASSPNGEPDTSVSFERPGVFSSAPAADVAHSVAAPPSTLYEASADVTDLVQLHGAGPYRVGDVASVELPDRSDSRAFITWSMVVFYRLAGEPLRQLTVFDGLDAADTGSGVVINVSGFLVPNAGIDAKLGIVAYGTDGQTGGDTLTFNGTNVSDGLGGTNNFFNGSRTLLGSVVSNAGDLPRLTGGERSMSGSDIDVVDVTTLVAPGSTTATIEAKAGGDNNVLVGALVTSITTFKPNFDDSIKSAIDLNGGELMPGDTLRYVIDVENTGNDPAVGVVLEDVVPAGVTFVPGSIQVLSGANVGPKTDPSGDDQGEYDAATRTVRIRLGTGANALQGGTMAIGAISSVAFDVTVDSVTIGIVSNQATIRASGQNGAPTATYTSTDATTPGPTTVVVDECAIDADCPSARPYCLLSLNPALPNTCVECLLDANCSGTTPVCDANNVCVPCASDADCNNPVAPACQTSGALFGACTECSATNDGLCILNKPDCLTTIGICGCTDTDGDSECGGANSGVICSGPVGTCVPGCSTAPGRNDCPVTSFCSDQTGGVGTCSPQPCLVDGDCSAPLPVCDTTPTPHVCVECLDDLDCAAPLICDTAVRRCVECTPTDLSNCSASGTGAACLLDNTCGCVTDADCGAVDSGRVCDGATSRCTIGCRGTGGNGCPSALVCTSTDISIGSCVTCVSDADCAVPTPLCDTAQNECVACLTSANCPSTAPVCSNGVCAGCQGDADCAGFPALPACHLGGVFAGSCRECSASNLSLCTAGEPQCLSTAVCGCSDVDGDAECGAPDSGIICNGPAGMCVPGCSTAPSRNDCPAVQFCTDQTGGIGVCQSHCVTNADCTTAPELVCDTSGIPHVCVECVSTADCASPLVCDTSVRRCVGCVTTADCPVPQVCDLTVQQCVGCLTDADCTAPDVCDTTTQTCVGCIDDSDCTAPEVCDTTAQTCVRCVDDGDCTAPDVCDTTTQTCVRCVDDGDCTAPQVCDTTAQTCVDCVDDTDCTAPSVCNTTTQTCVGCVDDTDCTAPDVCDTTTQTCVRCVEDADCTAPEVCDTAAQTCVDCVDDTDCTAPSVCDTTTQTCVGCVDDTDCTAPEVCDTTTQTCVGCVDDTDCMTPQVCDTTAQTCVDCVDDTDCTTPEVCDTSSQTCVGCVDDMDCNTPMVCDTAAQECVGCQTDADCPAPQVCDTATETCVECTPDNSDVCSAEAEGSACLDDNTCGCVEDSDCGGTTSGRICDMETSACTEGCRGTGGNGCPSGEECTSTTSEPGQCVEPEPADAGAPPNTDGIVEGGGCGCTVPGRQSDAGGALAALAALALVVSRRRRASAARRCPQTWHVNAAAKLSD